MVILSKQELLKKIDEITWRNAGDGFERRFYTITQSKFPLLERYWQLFVVPSTNRVLENGNDIRQPESIPGKISIIGNHNYVIFQRIIKCSSLIESNDYFATDDFYTHLVGIFDNFEQLVEKLNFLLLEYQKGVEPNFLKKLTKSQFLEIFETFYDNQYQKLFEDYKVRNRFSVELQKLSGQSLLEQLFLKNSVKAYRKLNSNIRQTRNLFVHSVRLGNVISFNGQNYIPKHQYVQKYKDDYRKVFEASKTPSTFQKEFVETRVQMKTDLEETMQLLNGLYKDLVKMIAIDELPNQYFEDNYSIQITK